MGPLMINMAFMLLYMWEMWDVTPVTHEHTDEQWKVVQYSVWAESAISQPRQFRNCSAFNWGFSSASHRRHCNTGKYFFFYKTPIRESLLIRCKWGHVYRWCTARRGQNRQIARKKALTKNKEKHGPHTMSKTHQPRKDKRAQTILIPPMIIWGQTSTIIP